VIASNRAVEALRQAYDILAGMSTESFSEWLVDMTAPDIESKNQELSLELCRKDKENEELKHELNRKDKQIEELNHELDVKNTMIRLYQLMSDLITGKRPASGEQNNPVKHRPSFPVESKCTFTPA
jgi:predicted RNase H-like nuclease (RuvC/YqgF family)